MPIVADNYEIVIGVYPRCRPCAVCCGRCNRCRGRTKQVFQQVQRVSIGPARGFPHRAGQQAALVVIEGIGSYGAGLSDRVLAAGLPVAEPSVMGSADRRGVGKTDDLDAARIARSVLSVDIDRLRRPRADGSRVAMRISRGRARTDDM